MSVSIPREQVRLLKKRQKDDVGQVFAWEGRIFRGIVPAHEHDVRVLFSTGFLDELMGADRFPKTWVTDYRMEGFSLILEHEKIWPVVYPQEWTFSMLRDAALFVYGVGLTAKRYGFNMKDCHGANVFFDGVSPKYIDLGSFIPDRCPGWIPYEAFLQAYYYPLHLWTYDSVMGRLSLLTTDLSSHGVFLLHQHPLLRVLAPGWANKLAHFWLMPECAATRVGHPLSLPIRLARRLIPMRSAALKNITRKIEEMRPPRTAARQRVGQNTAEDRIREFDRVIEILNALEGDIRSVIDLAGGRGEFARRLIQRTRVEKAICVDPKENAVDEGYNQERQANSGRLTFAHYDFMGDIVKLRLALPCERFRSDVVVVLGSMHRLLLSDAYPIDDIFKSMSEYARKYVLVEFSPPESAAVGQEPRVPSWYTQDWFRRTFMSFFAGAWEKPLGENRSLFVGRVPAAVASAVRGGCA